MSLSQSRRSVSASQPDTTSDEFIFTQAHLNAWGDGASRGNGTKSVQSAIGVFFDSYECPYNCGMKVDEPTNNRTELRSLIKLYQIIAIIKKKHPHIVSVTVHMDSTYVVSGHNEGRPEESYDKSHANSDLWCLLGEAVRAISDVIIEIKWIPRHLNRAADELCNAALDDRPVNKLITNTTSSPYSPATLVNAINNVTVHRFRAMTYIPQGLEPLFIAVVQSISTRFISDAEKRSLFIILPHLISVYTRHSNNHQVYKHLRTHLTMLTDEDYFNEHLLIMSQAQPHQEPQMTVQAKTPKQVVSLCRIGAFHKCIPSDDVTQVSDPTTEAIETMRKQGFPSQPLPPPLRVSVVTTTHSECFSAFRKLKSHKSSTLSGWTKELLFHIVTNVHLRDFVTKVMTSIINADLTEPELHLFKTSIALILQYRDKDKQRLCLLGDCLLKWAWHVVLKNTLKNDDNFKRSMNTFGMKNQCQVVIHTIQQIVTTGGEPTTLDAVSAFPTVSRIAAFQYLDSRRSVYERTFPLINMIYATQGRAVVFVRGAATHVMISSTGGNQGCVSGPYLHAFGTIRSTLKFHRTIAQVVDDVNIIRDMANVTPKVIEEFRTCNQIMDGPKMKTLTKETLPSRVLGGMIVHPQNTNAEIKKAIQSILDKVSKKYQSLLALDGSFQCKVLILKSVQWNWMFYLETWHPAAAAILADHIDTVVDATFFKMFPLLEKLLAEVNDPARYVLLHHPIEDGGVGLIPYRELADYLYSRSRNECHPIAATKFDVHLTKDDTPVSNTSMKGRWHQIFREQMSASRTRYLSLEGRMFCKDTAFISWMDTRPTNKWTTLEDEHYITALVMRFKLMYKLGVHCPTSGEDLDRLSPGLRYDHVVACRSCAVYFEKPRHDAVNWMLHRTFAYHTTASRLLKPFDMPVSSNEPKSASDLLVVTTRPFTIDVAISAAQMNNQSHKQMGARYNHKKNRYKRFQHSTGIETIPFVMSIHGVPAPATLADMDKLITHAINPSQLRKDIWANTQMELLRSLHNCCVIMSASLAFATPRVGKSALDVPRQTGQTGEASQRGEPGQTGVIDGEGIIQETQQGQPMQATDRSVT